MPTTPTAAELLQQAIEADSPWRDRVSPLPTDEGWWQRRQAELLAQPPIYKRPEGLDLSAFFLARLEADAERFPAAYDEALLAASGELLATLDVSWIAPAVSLMHALFGLLPEDRAKPLRHRLLEECLYWRRYAPSHFPEVVRPFESAVVERLLSLVAEVHAGGSEVVTFRPDVPRGTGGLVSWALIWLYHLSGQRLDALPPTTLELVEREIALHLAERWSLIMSNHPVLFMALPEARRIALMSRHPLSAELIAVSEGEDTRRFVVRRLIEELENGRRSVMHGLPISRNAAWTATILEVLPEAAMRAREPFIRFVLTSPAPPDDATLLRLLDLSDPHTRVEVLGELMQRPWPALRPLVVEAFETGREELRAALARLLGWAAIMWGEQDLLGALAQRAHPGQEAEAFELALERAHVDWAQLASWLEPLRQKQPLPVSAARQTALEAMRGHPLRPLLVRGALHMRSSPGGFGEEPLLIVHCVETSAREMGTSDRPWLFDTLRPILGAVLDGLFPLVRLADYAACYGWCCEEAVLSTSTHLHVLDHGTPSMQRLAGRQIAAAGAVAALIERLSARQAGVRTAAAQALAVAVDTAGLDALRRRLAVERTASVRTAIEEAIKVCERGGVGRESERLGTYALDAADPANAVLVDLRAVMFEPGEIGTWVRLCDVLERARQANALDVALAYVEREGIEGWPESMRVLPWGWEDPRLLALGSPQRPLGASSWWVPIARSRAEDFGALLDTALRTLEARARRRRLPHDQVAHFLHLIAEAWTWCQAHGVELDRLEARLDGGAHRGASRPESTSLELRHSFALALHRGPAFSGHNAPEGIRWLRIAVDKHDPLRDVYGVKVGARVLDLLPLLSR